ncbi:MAG: hypothetical protein CMJ89_08575 [Planctomycetes bacterium]|jgi:hypothetical protein|nr:hypothetical protein [Planctomycetota bacterium]
MSDPTQHLNTFDPDEDLSNARDFDAFFTTIADGTRLGLPLGCRHRPSTPGRACALSETLSPHRAEFLIRFPLRSTASASFGLPQTIGQF